MGRNMKLTKQLVKKFQNADIQSRMVNGYVKQAEAVVTYANGFKYVVKVSHTPNKLMDFGDISEVSFSFPDSKNSWIVYDVPTELNHILNVLAKEVSYTDEEIETYREKIINSLRRLYNEMGWVYS